MNRPENILSRFHPLIQQWFTDQFGQTTEVQEKGWTKITGSEHVLITAPTGSGKTLTAFLWAINQLVTGVWATGHMSVLYVSPLKALNNDIRRNLLKPLRELKEIFEAASVSFPNIRVLTRSGDTPQSDRRKMLHHPPDILITTPESLNLLLSSSGGRTIFKGLSTVILDEIHGVVGNKRGVHLITAVDRLVLLVGEFQRIALSATIRPLDMVAEFVGGFKIEGPDRRPHFKPRPVAIVTSSEKKAYRVAVRSQGEAGNQDTEESVWNPLVNALKELIGRNRSTLVFTNSRRLCEKLTLKINYGEDRPIAYAHHGSLSREIRGEVEKKMKEGELKAIVATNSLEMGIDIGALDEVVLIQSPLSISSAIQRIGRAGHQVGQVSCGTIFPIHPQDFLEAAVLASGILSQDIEAIAPIQCPLDVLAQVIISMVGVAPWDIDALYVRLTASWPYRRLNRDQFDLVLNMLAGRYSDSRIRELKPRVSIDRLDNKVTARRGALLALYTSGGTIPDRGYFHLRHHQTNAQIGELDEEFVWEATIGQTFTLGTQNWKIERITHNDVFVIPGHPKSMATPFWKGEERNRDFHFSMRIARFLEEADERLDEPGYKSSLKGDRFMDSRSIELLITFLKKQKESTGCALPHRHHCLIEFVGTGPGSVPGNQVLLHTLWGGRVNRPFAMALNAAWEERYGHRLEVYVGNDCVALLLPHNIKGEDLLSLVTGQNVETLLKKRLEGSGFFGARFRECAGRSLLLTRNRINERLPLWMSRLRSQKLLDAVLRYEDFPVLLEAWRTCLQDEFDLANLQKVLNEIGSGIIKWSETRIASPSPMARGVTWQQINQYMYRGDESSSGKRSKLRSHLLRDVVYTPGLRPTISKEIVQRFELKRKRLSPGYSPASSQDLLDWVKERIVIPLSEWNRLMDGVGKDQAGDPAKILQPIAEKLVKIAPRQASEPLIAALEILPRILHAFYGPEADLSVESFSPFGNILVLMKREPANIEEDPDEAIVSLVGEWLQFYGPISEASIGKSLGIEDQRLRPVVEALLDSERLITGQLVRGGKDNDVCDGENFEILLRLARTEAVPEFKPMDIEWLSLFLSTYQGLTDPADNQDGLFNRLEQLLCYRMPAGLWESDIFPARVQPYDPAWLDAIMQEGDLRWIGCKNRTLTFCFESDLDLLKEEDRGGGQPNPPQAEFDSSEDRLNKASNETASHLREFFPDTEGRYDFSTLLRITKDTPSKLSERLWEAAWESRVTNDTFISVRRGIENRFQVPDLAEAAVQSRRKRRASSGRSGFSRWKGSLPFVGNWFRLSNPDLSEDILETEERKKDRVRLLLERYGILFRELLARETYPFQWFSLFRSLRLMELSGEILSGYFFHGIPGPQFISHRAFRMLQREIPEDRVFWVNAVDPASLCGVPLEALKGSLPRRTASTHLVYCGKRLALVSTGYGRTLTFYVPPDDSKLQQILVPLRHLLTKRVEPLRRITIETINGEEAARSPYLDALRISFEAVVDYKKVSLFSSATKQ